MNDRERLIELVKNARDAELCLCQNCFDSDECLVTGYCDKSLKVEAASLIAHGVTIQKHGRWIMTLYTTTSKRGRVIANKKFACSECGYSNGRKQSGYCPNCGAKMQDD